MTPEQIAELAEAGHEIGSHSITHPFLTQATDSALGTELTGSKNRLESITHDSFVSFAYPYGDYDARVIDKLKDTGYRSGRSVDEGYNGALDLEAYNIRVQNIEKTTTLAEFQSWVDYAKAHNYWLVIVYHEVVPDGTSTCSGEEQNPCLDTTLSDFEKQLDYIAGQGLGANVETVQRALAVATNHYPAGTVSIDRATPGTNDVLTVETAGLKDPDGDPLTLGYQWSVNGTAIAGATAKTFDLSQAGHGDHGDTVSVDVSAADGREGKVTTSATVTVANTAPAAGAVAISPSSPVAGSDLTAKVSGSADVDGDALVFTFVWTRNGQPIGDGGDKLSGALSRAGDTIAVRVTVSDGHGGSAAAAYEVSVGAGTPPQTDRTPPQIVVTSPKARKYRRGQSLRIRFTCADASGYVSWKATLRRAGGKARTVKPGSKLRLSRTGTYVLSISATDAAGNTSAKTVRFRVVRR
jgi:hypothetical protein